MAIGILGGTFDPIHLGHLHLANEVLTKAQLSKIHVIPCYQSPLRKEPIAKPKERLDMIQLGILDNPNLVLDDQELKRQGISYTIDTLRNIRRIHENKQQPLALIMGIDAFNQFDAWHEWKNILELSHLIIVNRQNISFSLKNEIESILRTNKISDPIQLTQTTNGKILILNINPLPISSTEIRHLLKNGNLEKVQNMLPQKVWQYIFTNKIYF